MSLSGQAKKSHVISLARLKALTQRKKKKSQHAAKLTWSVSARQTRSRNRRTEKKIDSNVGPKRHGPCPGHPGGGLYAGTRPPHFRSLRADA